jgi:hypothetical protein
MLDQLNREFIMFKAKKSLYYAHSIKGGMNLSIEDKSIEKVIDRVNDLYNGKIAYSINKISDNGKQWINCYNSINN